MVELRDALSEEIEKRSVETLARHESTIAAQIKEVLSQGFTVYITDGGLNEVEILPSGANDMTVCVVPAG